MTFPLGDIPVSSRKGKVTSPTKMNQPLKIPSKRVRKAFVRQGLHALLYALDLNSVTHISQKNNRAIGLWEPHPMGGSVP